MKRKRKRGRPKLPASRARGTVIRVTKAELLAIRRSRGRLMWRKKRKEAE